MLREGAFPMETLALGGEEGKAPLLTLDQGASWQESRPALNWQQGNVVGVLRTGGQVPYIPRPWANWARQGDGTCYPLSFPSCLLALSSTMLAHRFSLSSVEAGKQSQESKVPLVLRSKNGKVVRGQRENKQKTLDLKAQEAICSAETPRPFRAVNWRALRSAHLSLLYRSHIHSSLNSNTSAYVTE